MKISCVCPTRESRRSFIDSLLRCFISQTHVDKELIILDEGYTPHPMLSHGTPGNIRYVFREDKGVSVSVGQKRNEANAMATGDIIAHFDDDDWSHPERLAEQLAFMEKTGKACVGYHDLLYFRMTDRTLWKYMYQGKPCIYATGTSQFYRRSAWEKTPFKNKIVGEDSQFSFDMKALDQLASEDGKKMVVARAHSGNTYVPAFGYAPFLSATRDEFSELFLKEHNL
jgi:glycosyltransferase involved in cell wall biosynthesis